MTSLENGARLLVVEDRDSLRRLLGRVFGEQGYRTQGEATVSAALTALAGAPFDLVVTDLRLPDGSGLEVVKACAAQTPPVPVLVMTAYGTVAAAVEAMKLGALDFLEKPVEVEDLRRRVAAIVAPQNDRSSDVARGDAVWSRPGAPPIVGRHPRMRAALHLLERVAAAESTVLLLGESGTGKELFARALHALSARRGPFVAVNCAAIPEGLVESELFGYEKGAFTGADRRQIGRFEAAHGGTLLLDEVGDLPLSAQGKVLRAIEERAIDRVGARGSGPTRVDVRLVAATNQHLRAMVDAGRFRQDLFFRLDVFPVELPALRERPSDVPLLAAHLLETMAERQGAAPLRLERSAKELLSVQPWPGNVRELTNLLERASLLHGDEARVLRAADLEPLLRSVGGGSAAAGPGAERERIRAALLEAAGDKQRAALLLGISYRTLQRRVVAFDLEGFPRHRKG